MKACVAFDLYWVFYETIFCFHINDCNGPKEMSPPKLYNIIVKVTPI